VSCLLCFFAPRLHSVSMALTQKSGSVYLDNLSEGVSPNPFGGPRSFEEDRKELDDVLTTASSWITHRPRPFGLYLQPGA
jgi:hypothetical protein